MWESYKHRPPIAVTFTLILLLKDEISKEESKITLYIQHLNIVLFL